MSSGNLISGDFPVKGYRNLGLGVTGQVVKASKGQVFTLYIYNAGAAARYIKFYDKATAPDQTDTPSRTYGIGAGQAVTFSISQGLEFLNGISVRATTGVADNDTGAPGANDVVINIGYL